MQCSLTVTYDTHHIGMPLGTDTFNFIAYLQAKSCRTAHDPNLVRVPHCPTLYSIPVKQDYGY
jgi:hypothetical protein